LNSCLAMIVRWSRSTGHGTLVADRTG